MLVAPPAAKEVLESARAPLVKVLPVPLPIEYGGDVGTTRTSPVPPVPPVPPVVGRSLECNRRRIRPAKLTQQPQRRLLETYACSTLI